MSADMTDNLIYIAAAVLLPLIPAYILYKTLPAKANVVGPLGKFTLKLSGAFAGYFALVIIVFGFVYSRPKPCPAAPPCPTYQPERYSVYKVQGVLQPKVGDEDLTRDTNLTLRPWMEMQRSGFFEFVVAVDQDSNATSKSLEITHEGFLPEVILLTENIPENIASSQRYAVRFDESAKTIQIEGPIVLRKEEQPYSPSRGKELTPVPVPVPYK